MKETKRSKRLMSMMVALAMMLSMVVSMNVSAAGVPFASYDFASAADISGKIGQENLTLSFDETNSALKVVTTANADYYHLYLQDNWAALSYDKGEEYTISFKAKTDAQNATTKINPIETAVQDLQSYAIGNEWTEHSVTFTSAKGAELYLKIHPTDAAVSETIYFEYIKITTKAPALDIASSSIESGKINPGTNSLTIQFTNKLASPTASNFVLSGGTQSVTSVAESANNTYTLTLSEALTVNTPYSLNVNVTDIYEQNFNKSFSFAASANIVKEWHFNSDTEIGNINTEIYNSTWNGSNVSRSLDTDNSMKITSKAGAEWFALQLRSNYDPGFLVAGKVYNLSYKIKATNVTGLELMKNTLAFVKKLTTPTSEYVTYVATFTASDNNMPVFKMLCDSSKEATINIDDIILTTAPAENSITSSTPANGSEIDITNVIKVAFSNEMNAASVANPANYVIEGGTQTVNAVTKQSDGSYAIELDSVLTPNKEYTLTINAVDIYAQKLENNTIIFTTSPAKEVINFTFDDNSYFSGTGINWVIAQGSGATLSEGEDNVKVVTANADTSANQMWLRQGYMDEAGKANLMLQSGKRYTLSLKVKSDADSGRTIGLRKDTAIPIGSDKSVGTQWKTISTSFNGYNGEIYFVFAGQNATYWIDDIMITTAPDALVLSSSTPEAGSTVEATDSMTLTFNNDMGASVSDKSKYAINDAEIKSIDKQSDGTYKITFTKALAPAKNYTLSINGVEDIYGQALTTTISFATLTDNRLHYDMPAVYLDYDTEAKRAITTVETGNVSAAVENIRNLTSADAPIFVAIALYKDGALVEVKSDFATVKSGEELESLSATINVPETRTDGNYTIKAFMWDNNLRPYENAVELFDYTLTTLRVSLDGNGDFTSPFSANKAIKDSSVTNRYVIEIQPGTYEGTMTPGTFVAPYTTWKGTDRESCIIVGKLDDSLGTTEAGRKRIDEESTINLKESANLENLTITGENLRYPVHNEGGGANPDAIHLIKNCHIEHLGTRGATDAYFAAGGTDPYAVWQWTTAWGYGSASGVINIYDNTTFKSVQRAWYVHSQANFEKPQINILNNCHLSAGNLQDITVESLGSTTNDKVVLNNCTFDGLYIQTSDSPWINSSKNDQYADHSEYEIILNNCDPLGYTSIARGKALAIYSNNTTGTSSVKASGEAAEILLGDYTTKAGGGGLSSFIYGYYDISGILVGMTSTGKVNNTIGRRLGDCSSENITMQLIFDEASTVDIVFDKDYTEMSNTDILAEINAQISAYGRAEEYNVSKNEHYPQFTDKELKLTNASNDAIKRFSAVCYDEDGNVRNMTSEDSKEDFVGVALENIVPGAAGRILTEGYLNASQLGLSGVNNGDFIAVSGAGSYEKSNTNAIFSCSNENGWAYFKAN